MQLWGSLNILWHRLSLGLKWKLIFPVCGHFWVFQFCWHLEFRTLTALSFRIWNNSSGILSPPLALLVVMLPKAHLTLHYRISDSRWVTTPSLLVRKAVTNLKSVLRSRDIALLKKGRSQSYSFVSCESSTIRKAEHQRIDALNCGVGEDSWESLGQQGDQTSQS